MRKSAPPTPRCAPNSALAVGSLTSGARSVRSGPAQTSARPGQGVDAWRPLAPGAPQVPRIVARAVLEELTGERGGENRAWRKRRRYPPTQPTAVLQGRQFTAGGRRGVPRAGRGQVTLQRAKARAPRQDLHRSSSVPLGPLLLLHWVPRAHLHPAKAKFSVQCPHLGFGQGG